MNTILSNKKILQLLYGKADWPVDLLRRIDAERGDVRRSRFLRLKEKPYNGREAMMEVQS